MSTDNARSSERVAHTFALLPIGTAIPDMPQITSVAVVPFNDDGEIVVALLNHRGMDLPGGHVENVDATCEDTARRETLEEICARLGELKLVGIIESTMLRNGKPTYMVAMAGSITHLEPLHFAAGEESSDRMTISVDKFLQQYRGLPQMSEIVLRAQKIYKEELSPVRSTSPRCLMKECAL